MHLWISHPRDLDAYPAPLEPFEPEAAHAGLAWSAAQEARRLRELLVSLTPRYERARWERDLVAGMDARDLERLRRALRMPRFADAEGHVRELRDARAELEMVEDLLRRLARSAEPDAVPARASEGAAAATGPGDAVEDPACRV